jgi:hypothetical protein
MRCPNTRPTRFSYFDFFFLAFFFAMMIFLVCVMNLRQGWFRRRLIFDLGPWASAPLPKTTMPQRACERNRKIAKNLYFSVA